MASSKENQKRTKRACNALKLLGISAKDVKSALKRLLEAYENNWMYIEEENYRVLIDAIFETEEPMVLDKPILRLELPELGFCNYCEEPEDEDIEPLRKRPRRQTRPSSPAGNSVPCSSNSASEMQQMVEHDFGALDIVELDKPKPIRVYQRRVSNVRSQDRPSSPKNMDDMNCNLFGDSDGKETEARSQYRPSSPQNMDDKGNEFEDENVTPCSSQIDIVSSSNGEVKLALSICGPSHGFRITSLDEAMRQLEETYRENFQGLGSKFTLLGLFKELCEWFVEQGNASDGSNQSRVQTFENFMEPEKQFGRLRLSNAPSDHTDAPVPIPRYVVSSPFTNLHVVNGVYSDDFNRTFRKQKTPVVDNLSASTCLTLSLKDDSLPTGIQPKLRVFMTAEGKGWGLRTLEDLPKGTFICDMELFEHNEEKTDEKALCLDATSFGNVARFINHRCEDANLVAIPVEVESPDHQYYRHAFFTGRDVKATEELTWGYGIDFDDDSHPVKPFHCKCGSRFCRQSKHKNEEANMANDKQLTVTI